MYTFALNKIEVVYGKSKFYALIENNKCQYDIFCSKVTKDGNLVDELDKVIKIIERLSSNQEVSRKWVKPLKKSKGDKIIDYEIRTDNLRFYYIHDMDKNYTIVLGGYKKNQPSDIEKMRKIKKRYLDWRKNETQRRNSKK